VTTGSESAASTGTPGAPETVESTRGSVRATVLIRPKAGILDPQGDAVRRSLSKLGFDVSGVRVGRVVDLEVVAAGLDDARSQVDRMCSELLANPLIESFEIRLDME
jgi:phosphoribosylformylglycinamidine synthase